MAQKFTTSYMEDVLIVMRRYKALAEGAMAQVTDAELLLQLNEEMNSIALNVKHMAGNMRSRSTDFLTTDGEKPNRFRDTEFENPPQTREEVMRVWEEGWKVVFSAIEPLSDADGARTVTVYGEALSAMQAINRQFAHYCYHCGQIVFLAKYFRGSEFKTLSVPRRKSAAPASQA